MRRGLCSALVLLLLAGCSSGSFVGRRIDNFTAHYNAFYNAKRAYEKGVKALQPKDQVVNRDQYLPIFPETGAGSGSKELQDAVKKSADVLRKHPESKWVDDALLLIGKSYFYQKNFTSADQKFREVMTLGSALDTEARFWLARSLVESGSFDEAARHLSETLAREDLSPRWAPMIRLVQAEMHVRRGEWQDAVEDLKAAQDRARGRATRARVQYLLAQLYETLGQYNEAIAAYRNVERYNPVYDLIYAARLSAARVAGIHGSTDGALQALRRMERDGKNYGSRLEIAAMRGRILQSARQYDDAFWVYDGILQDEAIGSQGNVRGRVHYALGELYRDGYNDFVMAAAHFDTASTTLVQPKSAQPQAAGSRADAELLYTKEAIRDSKEKAEVYKSFARVVGEVAEMDSLLRIGTLDDEAFRAWVLALRERKAEELAEQEREAARRAAEQGFQDAAVGADPALNQGQRSISATESSAAGAGFLFHKDPSRIRDGQLLFSERWGDRPLVPNWRRQEVLIALTVAEEAGTAGASTAGATGRGVRSSMEPVLPHVDVSAVPRTESAREALLEKRAQKRYELGNVLFLSMSRPDSAAAWYRMVIEEPGDEDVARRAYYALAEVHRALGDTVSAGQLYRFILQEHPDSEFGDRVRERLGMDQVDTGGRDSLALAETAYARALTRWKAGRHRESIGAMVKIAAAYPTTSVAPKALFAAASAYAEWASQDSLDLLAALPLALPDSVLRTAGLAAPQPAVAAAAIIAPASQRQALADSIAAVRQAEIARNDTATIHPAGAALNGPAGGDLERTDVPPVHLQSVYQAITARYPESPYVDPARRMLKVLEEQQKARKAVQDSLLAADSTAKQIVQTSAEGKEGPVVADSVAVPAEAASGLPGRPAPADTLHNAEALPATDVMPQANPVDDTPEGPGGGVLDRPVDGEARNVKGRRGQSAARKPEGAIEP